MASALLNDHGSTLADFIRQLGDIAPDRILMNPLPGTATEEDAVRLIESAQPKACELIDGVLVEKAMGVQESFLAMRLALLLGNFLELHDLGFLTDSQGMARMISANVRIPDISFFAWEQLPTKSIPNVPIMDCSPALAIEVLSPTNTPREMRDKRNDYFASGTRVVWELDPSSRTVRVYSGVQESVLLSGDDSLTGEPVLPGFVVTLPQIFGKLDR